jgi:hypothetical protein
MDARSLGLIVVEVVRAPVPPIEAASQETLRLLRLANSWLQRRADRFPDDLLLIGTGFDSESSFRGALVPYGFDSAKLIVLGPVLAEDPEDEGKDIASLLSAWLDKNHKGALPLAGWPAMPVPVLYPNDLWWLGIKAVNGRSAFEAGLASLIPLPFSVQAATWSEVFEHAHDTTGGGSAQDELREWLAVAGYARWLAGFSAASDDTFFDFDYSVVEQAFELDRFSLGFEAARECLDDVSDAFDSQSVEDATTSAVKALLRTNRYFDESEIRAFFGGKVQLFFTLHTSIWPDRSRPTSEVVAALCGLETADFDDIQQPWRFVADGDWSFIDESD